jgi:undecaprenyl-diphosphatase
MDIFQAAILGVVEGFTEFLPISSTGHLIVLSDFMGLEQSSSNKAFEVIIQLAAIFAVFFLYRDKFSFSKLELWKKVMIAYLPLAIVGFIFRHEIKELFSILVVAWMFVIGGVVFLLAEKFYREDKIESKEVEQVSYKQAIFIGFAQVFALIPGTSRSGATMIGGMFSGLSRTVSAEFSFLLAFPVMATVCGYDMLKHYQSFAGESFAPLLVGFVISFVVAVITIKLFMKFLEKFSFVAFGIYRIVFGLILLWWFV